MGDHIKVSPAGFLVVRVCEDCPWYHDDRYDESWCEHPSILAQDGDVAYIDEDVHRPQWCPLVVEGATVVTADKVRDV